MSLNPSPSYSQIPSTDQLPTYTEDDAEELLGQYPPPPRDVEPLPLPVAVPQIASSYDSPFLRAYNPELERSGVEQEEWLRFVDGLNIAMVSTAVLSVIFNA